MEPTKRCTGPCTQELPESAFHRKGPKHRHAQCPRCRADANRAYRHEQRRLASLATEAGLR